MRLEAVPLDAAHLLRRCLREQGANARDHVVRHFAKDDVLRAYEKLLTSMVS